MLKIDISELQTGLKEVQGRIERIAREQKQVTFDKLFSPAFMRQHTKYASFELMVHSSPFKVENAEDFRAIPDADWDQYVKRATAFSSWAEMMQVAANEYMAEAVREALK